ncbi:MerR family DNA-binding transcriptional regulator [Streptomyces pseudoechinosporeus]
MSRRVHRNVLRRIPRRRPAEAGCLLTLPSWETQRWSACTSVTTRSGGDNTFWSIGEVARKTGLSVKLIRHWSDAGVVHPARRTSAGYRLYGTEALFGAYRAKSRRSVRPASAKAASISARPSWKWAQLS